MVNVYLEYVFAARDIMADSVKLGPTMENCVLRVLVLMVECVITILDIVIVQMVGLVPFVNMMHHIMEGTNAKILTMIVPIMEIVILQLDSVYVSQVGME